MARAPKAGQLSSLPILVHRIAKRKDQISSFSTYFTILTDLKMVTGNLIVENIRSEPIGSSYGEASSLESVAYLSQKDSSKVLDVRMMDERYQHESNMDVPENQNSR